MGICISALNTFSLFYLLDHIDYTSMCVKRKVTEFLVLFLVEEIWSQACSMNMILELRVLSSVFVWITEIFCKTVILSSFFFLIKTK